MLLLAVVAVVAVWRARDDQERHHSLERTSAAATSLEHAHARFFEGLGVLAALVWAQDATFSDMYRQAAAEVEQGLSRARAEALAEGNADHAAALDNLIERLGRFDEGVELFIPTLLEAGPEERAQIAIASLPELMPEAYVIRDELDRLVQEKQEGLAAERAAADRAAEFSLWLLVGSSAAAFVGGAAAIAMLMASVVRPLAWLRASVSAITSGDLEARAKVAGPEEVASLARDFNKMVSERKRAEERVEHFNSVLRAISDVNQLLVKEKDRERLLKGVCDSLSEARGYYNVWIALVDESGGLITGAEAGLGKDFLQMAERLKRGEWPACARRSIAQSGPVTMEDPPSTCGDCPLANNYGGRGAMIVRLEHSGKVYGFLAASIPAEFIADEEEGSLLREVAGDIAFALHGIELEEERKRMEEALRENEARYRDLLDTLAAAAFIFQGPKLRYVNSAAAALTGYAQEELLGMEFWDVVHTDFRQLVKKRGEGRQRGEAVPQTYEVKLVTKSGEERWVHFTAAAIEFEDKPAVLGTAFDITKRKRGEEALRERTRDLGERVKELSCLYGMSGLIQTPGISLVEMLKETAKLIPQGWRYPDVACARIILEGQEFCTENFRETTWSQTSDIVVDGDRIGAVQACYLEEKPQEDEGPFLKEERSLINAIAERLGRLVERRRAEEALRESEAKFRQIFENAQDIFYQTDAQGIITEISPSVEGWGFTREELIGTQVLDVYESPEERSALLKALLEQGAVLHHEIHLKTGDGRVVDTSVNAHLLRGPDGTLTGVEGSLRDISDTKRMEEALREQARRDPLTRILNHSTIVGELRNLISDGGDGASHAVAMVDVNGLKAINDTYGHQFGDTVLVEVAGALSRDGAIVGRYGGDEFVAVLPGAGREAAEGYRQEVLSTLAGTELRDPESGASVAVAASVGLAIYPNEAGRIEELIKLADSEMYAAKRQRPVGRSTRTPARPLGREQAAKMVGELVPLLTAPGDLNEKLRLVAHRLTVGAGYYVVAFQVVFGPLSEESTAQNVFGLAREETTRTWIRDNRRLWEHPLRPALERAQRPIILDDPQHDERLTANDRKLARAGGVRSVLVAPMIWRDKLAGHLTAMSRRKAAFTPRDAEFLMAVATQVTAIVRMSKLIDDLKSTSARLAEAQAETVMMLAAAAEAHDHTTGLHLQNVRGITEALARDLGYSEGDAKGLGLSALLHDIGKVRVPDSMLSSTGRLADEEWELMKHHTTWGAEFLAGRPGFELAATIARSHHEHWDGSGYPEGLAGEAIPEAATIVAVADAFDAMISDRPYRPARSVARALREIRACAGKQFSPRVVTAMARLHKRRMLPLPQGEADMQEAAA